MAAYEAAMRIPNILTYFENLTNQNSLCEFPNLDEDIIEKYIKHPRFSGVHYLQQFKKNKFIDYPILRKENVIDQESKYINSNKINHNIWAKTTSASSGPPLIVPYSEDFYIYELFLTIPSIASSHWISSFDGRLCVNISDNINRDGSIYLHPNKILGLQIDLPIDLRIESNIPHLIEYLEASRPAIICSRPEILDFICKKLDRKICFDFCQLIVSSGSFLNNERRKFIEEKFSSKVVNAYASTELGLIAWEHQNSQELTLNRRRFLAEVDDKSNELIVTGFSNDMMPFLRYGTQDIIANEIHKAGYLTSFNLDNQRHIPIFWMKNKASFLPTYYHNTLIKKGIWNYTLHQPEIGIVEIFVRDDSNTNRIYEALAEAEGGYVSSKKYVSKNINNIINQRYTSNIEEY